MFKRGGSSFQSQGTGITSPYDTPRKNYKLEVGESGKKQLEQQPKIQEVILVMLLKDFLS